MDWTKKELERIQARGLFRSLKAIEQKSGTRIEICGKRLVNFCGNDYLGLAGDPRVKKAGAGAVKKWGTSASASRLVSGNFSIHLELENLLAKFKGAETGLVFPSGYQANLGVIPALVGKGDLILSDEWNHSSLIDASRLSSATVKIFPHSDLSALKKMLAGAKPSQKKLILVESIYSMDGDLAPLPEIVELAEKFSATVYLDEAHSTGVLGKKGKGALEHFQISGKNLILMGTLSKALASQGGFVCVSKAMRDFLVNRARSFIFSTGLNPSAVASALKALEIIESEPERVAKLRGNIHFARQELEKIGVALGVDPTPIIPVILGDPDQTVSASKKLLVRGIFVQAIRPPSVPRSQSRLRISLSAGHTRKEISLLAKSLAEII